MRGKEKSSFCGHICMRITPAYAGKSFPEFRPVPELRDHPRLCGEKTVQTIAAFEKLGSPPPMRGKGSFCIVGSVMRRITPAYAGKSNFKRRCETLCRDHPRLCGEKMIFGKPLFHSIGSPPPMRGKVHEVSAPNGYVGITPAYAGKSLSVP